MPSGIQHYGCKLTVGPKGGFWIAMPSTIRRDADGKPVLGADGKVIWDQHAGFRNKAIHEKFEAAVLPVLRRQHPELFGDGQGEP
jgi:hypothetical protein